MLPVGVADVNVLFDSDELWLYHTDIPPREQGEYWARKLPQCTVLCQVQGISVSYFLCENDLCIPVRLQKTSIAMMERESGRMIDVTTIRAGHCPFVSSRRWCRSGCSVF